MKIKFYTEMITIHIYQPKVRRQIVNRQPDICALPFSYKSENICPLSYLHYVHVRHFTVKLLKYPPIQGPETFMIKMKKFNLYEEWTSNKKLHIWLYVCNVIYYRLLTLLYDLVRTNASLAVMAGYILNNLALDKR